MRAYDTDPDALGDQIAKLLGCSKDVIADVRVITSLDGAASIEVDLIDPDRAVLEGGALTPTDRKVTTTDPNITQAEASAGHGPYSLPIIDINYPAGSDYWWRLSEVSPQSSLQGGANVTLTFETRIVAYLRHHHGPPLKSMSRNDATRAQFIKWITADEVKAAGGIRFVSPEIDDPQPILEPDTGS